MTTTNTNMTLSLKQFVRRRLNATQIEKIDNAELGDTINERKRLELPIHRQQ